jgi:thiol-disulfide isomerase/thioredoxin
VAKGAGAGADRQNAVHRLRPDDRYAPVRVPRAGRLYEKERPSGDECAARLGKLARQHPGESVAFEALAWTIEYTRDTPAAEQALRVLRRDCLTVKRLGEVCSVAIFSPHYDAAEQLLREALKNSPHRGVRGQACLALAEFLTAEAGRARFAQRQRTPEAVQQLEKTFGRAEAQRRRSADPAALEAEAMRLYERVVADFADVWLARSSQSLGAQARGALDEKRMLAVGCTAPDIEGEDLEGKPLRLSDHRGKVVVLTFWATWCGPCRTMIPQERELVKRLAGQPFVLLGVHGDGDREALRRWLDKNPLPWRSWRDGREEDGNGQGRIARAWHVSAWPTGFVLDPRGTIRYRDVTGKDLDDAVDVLLKEARQGR